MFGSGADRFIGIEEKCPKLAVISVNFYQIPMEICFIARACVVVMCVGGSVGKSLID